LNSKQTWKLSNFELACRFDELSAAHLLGIYEHKCKRALTPEEEELAREAADGGPAKSNADAENACRQHPHALDAYAWAMMLLNLFEGSQERGEERNSISASLSGMEGLVVYLFTFNVTCLKISNR
jgi:hypothetical protein